ncbi:hypothetical protein PHAVU_005G085700 [Phaseolus vulgaris]|uniref:Double-strand break repair protein n=1 Tax=Phaseolus vulgaris TaxID=3885 RepID=V7BUH1_PHAVU|nr:hypothetical protein PHAVU_005G085700g [Phaseolus vulgaris]ESW21624.1 hypothetical protein PHAVU_005G085700g [Phaseolus vulgaris]
MMEGGDAANMLRILVATDCHLGYMEKDEVRRHDSFHAFEEICAIAERQRVDFVLLGGDLFHENKPSRSTLVKAIEILRRYCLNDRPVPFQVVSDQTLNFQNAFGHVNYEDPHFNVGLPVFTIHGNHDDPAGVDNLSVVDILSACNLVNYFGKTVLGGSGVGQITLHPILIRKGSTAVALYGLGNIRDERLNRMFQTPHAVQWMRPESQEGCQVSDWFNILVLHQNRVKTNPKNAINEHFLPRFLDFIVWGHEHECLVDPQEVPGMGFHISQPGSSVATSLIDGESKPKHVLLVEIKGNQYRPTKIPLMSVRPFEYTEVILKDEPDIDPNDQSSILEHLDKVVGKLIEKSSKQAVNRKELKLPLIRVKVDYSGFMTINPQRFGQKYVGKVANPQDILIFSKATKRAKVEGKIDDSERLRPEELNQQNIEALVAESNLKMEILPVNDLDIALQNFVNKDDKLAFYSCVQYNIQETRNKIAKDSDNLKFEEEDLIIKVGECLEERVKGRSAPSKESTQLNAGAQPWKDFQGRSAAGTGSTAASFSDDEDAIPVSSSKPSTRGRKWSTGASQTATRGRGRGRGRGSSTMKQTTLDGALEFRSSQRSASVAAATAIQSDANEDNLASTLSDDAEKNDVEEIDDSSENESKIPPGRNRAASRGRGRGSTQSSKRGRKSDNSSIHRMIMNNDDDDDDDNDDIRRRLNNSQPRVTKSYGALRR